MLPPPRPENETERLAALRSLVVLDSAPEPLFDSLVRMASERCGTPVALISLVDAERQWFKANVGLPGVHETPRDISFCGHAIADDQVFEVPDAIADERFADNPLVTGQPDIRFYAGAPLRLPGGERVGTLCVIDRCSRQLDPGQVQALQDLAGLAVQALTMRRDLIERALGVRTEFEQRLARSEERHRQLVESQSELVSLAQPDGRLVYVNPAYARHFGLEAGAMVGHDLFEWVEPADHAAVRARLDAVLASGQPLSDVNRMVSADGRERWVAWTNSVQHEANGQLLLHSVGRDISAQRRAERALQDSQAFLERTGRVAGVGGWQLDFPSGRLDWSPVTRRIHEVGDGYVPTVETAIGFYAPEAREPLREAIRAAVDEGRPWDLELPLVTATGRPIWVRAVGEVERDVDGRPLRLAGALQDITARKQLEQRLADGERFVRLITDHLPQAIAYLDPELRHRFVNDTLCRRLGLARDMLLGRTRAEVSDDGSCLALDRAAQAALGGQTQQLEYEESVQGERRRVEAHLLPDLAPDGRVRGLFLAATDITERSAIERSLRELSAILERSSDFVVQTDRVGAVTYVNPALRRFAGLGETATLAGRHLSEFHPTGFEHRYRDEIMPALRRHGVWVGQTQVLGAGQRQVPVSHLVIAHPDASGQVDRFSSVMRDISDSVRDRQALALQADTLAAILEAVPALVAVVGLDRRYRYLNRAFERWAGRARSEIVGRTMTEVLGDDEAQQTASWAARALAGETVSFEQTHARQGGGSHLAVTMVPLRLANGVVDGYVGVAQDITQHRREAVRLLELSQRDPLTGLLNRAGFEQALEQALALPGSEDLALLYIDLDRFKPVNDSHGHAVGDEVLRQFAQRLRTLVRPTDAVARLGGDEFAVVLAAVHGADNAARVGDKVVQAAAQPFEVQAQVLSIGASVGVAYGADRRTGWRELLARADQLLYQAKGEGRSRVAHAPQ